MPLETPSHQLERLHVSRLKYLLLNILRLSALENFKCMRGIKIIVWFIKPIIMNYKCLEETRMLNCYHMYSSLPVWECLRFHFIFVNLVYSKNEINWINYFIQQTSVGYLLLYPLFWCLKLFNSTYFYSCVGISFLLLPCRSWVWIQIIRPESKPLLLSHLTRILVYSVQ